MDWGRTSWARLPHEIQNDIISLLPGLGGTCSQLATVSHAWQCIIEPRNFAEISLTVPRLADPNSRALLFRKRHYIRYIWFRVELKTYDCKKCINTDRELWGLDGIDNQFIVDAFQDLFAALGAWEPRGDLILDISIYSPSDNQHWFKYLSFYPDTSLGECPSLDEHEQAADLINDPAHGWVAGQQVRAPGEQATEVTFDEIMAEGPFEDEEPEMQWWRSLPLVPVVGVMLLRQQTRRRWKPVALANMLKRFPNMKELCYEPWREWGNQTLIESFPQTQLRKLAIFENFNDAYPERYFQAPAIRVPSPVVSQKLARASLQLTMLSASFIVDAGHFFAILQTSWTWDILTSLALTSRVLTNDADPLETDGMLKEAASAALKMPRLDTMEIWNARRGVALLFRYQRAHNGQSANITIRGTAELTLGATAMQAWEAVAHQHGQSKLTFKSCSLIDSDAIRCHGDAIRELKLLTHVIRPISLRQIIHEHQFRV
ncbi:hypothetical protein NLG97_g5705 [Lecanicillium saksenae]|uniref:Uncharacterized protein n=1 Tax=Lecanicillium saksenae TaxID=468837 RepID=A0ACC1QRP0_9HYPO|nr:hypothetical protein NLG97_g5705 [Lecanicillium saksenae]